METINVSIPNMKSTHCQMTVASALKAIGATIKSLAPAKAEIEMTNGSTKEAIIAAIEKAGYTVTR